MLYHLLIYNYSYSGVHANKYSSRYIVAKKIFYKKNRLNLNLQKKMAREPTPKSDKVRVL